MTSSSVFGSAVATTASSGLTFGGANTTTAPASTGSIFGGGGAPGTQFNRNIFVLSFGLKNGLRFNFDSETCLNYPFLNVFYSVGNLKPKLKLFFKPKLKPTFFY